MNKDRLYRIDEDVAEPETTDEPLPPGMRAFVDGGILAFQLLLAADAAFQEGNGGE